MRALALGGGGFIGSHRVKRLKIDECQESVWWLTRSDPAGPVNIGSEEMVTINQLAETVIGLSGKRISIRNVPGPTGVRGRNSDNRLIAEKLGWQPHRPLREGLARTYDWVHTQVRG